jgi:hypothetical protein
VTVVPGTTYTVSFYALAGTATTVNYFIYNVTANSVLVANVDYVPLLNSSTWTRVSFSFTVPAGCTSIFVDLARSSGNGTVNLWGAQMEAGAFATSYIPTVASQVTRAADNASMIGNNFARWYNVNEGTFFAQAMLNRLAGSANDIFNASDNTFSNQIRFFQTTVLNFGFAISSGGVLQSSSDLLPALTTGTSYKVAGAYQTNNVASINNAISINTDNLAVIPVVNIMRIGGGATGAVTYNGTIARIGYWPRRLANTELTALTS